MMGSKTRARQNMKKAGVPFVPGSEQGMEYEATEQLAEQIGYPVMLKAAAGGGGKGMRLVHKPEDLRSALRERAQRGAARLRRQRGVPREGHRQSAPRRDADLRRRARQRGLSRRARVLGAAAPSEGAGRSRPRPSWMRTCGAAWARVAVRVAKAANYQNAGTVEFLVDQQTQLLLPRDEHAPAGGASGDRVRHRP